MQARALVSYIVAEREVEKVLLGVEPALHQQLLPLVPGHLV